MPILVDATVLSNLAAVGRFDLLEILNDTMHVASAVYEEIQQGLDEGYELLAEVARHWTLAASALSPSRVNGSGAYTVQCLPNSNAVKLCRLRSLTPEDGGSSHMTRRPESTPRTLMYPILEPWGSSASPCGETV